MYESNHTYCEKTLFKRKNLHAKIVFELFYQSDILRNYRTYEYFKKWRGYSYSAKIETILSDYFSWHHSKIPQEYWSQQLSIAKEKAKGKY